MLTAPTPRFRGLHLHHLSRTLRPPSACRRVTTALLTRAIIPPLMLKHAAMTDVEHAPSRRKLPRSMPVTRGLLRWIWISRSQRKICHRSITVLSVCLGMAPVFCFFIICSFCWKGSVSRQFAFCGEFFCTIQRWIRMSALVLTAISRLPSWPSRSIPPLLGLP